MADDQQKRTRPDLPGGAQVFGSGITALLAAVTAATLAGALVAIFAAVAMFFATAALMVGFNRAPWRRRKAWTVTGSAVIAVAMIVAVVLTLPVKPAGKLAAHGSPGQARGNGAEPVVIMSSPVYRLRPSASIRTNDQDKVDLDTACPGHGPTTPQLGPSRCGENADLIIEETELFTWKRESRLALLPAGEDASYATCVSYLVPAAVVSSVELTRLKPGSQFCVRTDKDSIAAVRVKNLTRTPELELSFDVWPSQE